MDEEPVFYELDPQGDVLLILQNPNKQELIESCDEEIKPNGSMQEIDVKDDECIEEDPKQEEPEQEEPEQEEPEQEEPEQQTIEFNNDAKDDSIATVAKAVNRNEVYFELSSRHLILASPVFKAMLSGGWQESTLSDGKADEYHSNHKGESKAKYVYRITASEWDEHAFHILMTIIHGRHRQVPSQVDLETLAKVSVLVDYYQCHEITEIFVKSWVDHLKGALPNMYGRDSSIWNFVSWAFSYDEIFRKMTQIAMQHCSGPLKTWNLPIPDGVLAAIESKRRDASDGLVEALKELRDNLEMGRNLNCDNLTCRSILLGSLILELRRLGVGGLVRLEVYADKSISEFRDSVSSIQSPGWYDQDREGYYDKYLSQHRCNLREKLNPTLGTIWSNLAGLELKDFGGDCHK